MFALWALIGLVLALLGLTGGKLLALIIALGACAELLALLHRLPLQTLIPPLANLPDDRPNTPACLCALALILAGHFFGFSSIGTSLGLIILIGAHWNSHGTALTLAILSVGLIALGLGSIIALATLPCANAVWIAVWVIATIKLSDANAYLIGRYFGKRRIATHISPLKSYEGLGGALLGGLIMGTLGAPLVAGGPLGFALGPLLGVLLAFVGACGDMAESGLKRLAQVKDSGHWLPGIGGLLDLTDSLLTAAPVAWVVLKFLV